MIGYIAHRTYSYHFIYCKSYEDTLLEGMPKKTIHSEGGVYLIVH